MKFWKSDGVRFVIKPKNTQAYLGSAVDHYCSSLLNPFITKFVNKAFSLVMGNIRLSNIRRLS